MVMIVTLNYPSYDIDLYFIFYLKIFLYRFFIYFYFYFYIYIFIVDSLDGMNIAECPSMDVCASQPCINGGTCV